MMTHLEKIQAAKAALERLEELRTAKAAELAAIENAFRPSGHDLYTRRPKLSEELNQIVGGVSPRDGTFPALAALIHDPTVACLRLPGVGITPLEQLLARLEEEQQETPHVSPPWPRPYRLRQTVQLHVVRGDKEGKSVIPKPFPLPDRDLQPGETMLLSADQADAWGDLFEPSETL